MGKASSNKKVARAATTGGGRTARGRTPWAWYTALTLAVLLGVAGVVFSRHQRETELAAGTTVPPRLANPAKNQSFDHWHEAYGFYLCDHFAANLPDDSIKGGIHTHADGLIHVEPQTVDDAGAKATLGRFLKLAGVSVSETEIAKVPGEKTYKNGDKCGDKTGEVKVFVDGKLYSGDPNKIRLTDQGKVVIAFVDKDTDTVPDPPSISALTNPNANEPGATTTPTTAVGETTTTTAPGTTGSSLPITPATTATPTTAPPATTSTTAKK